MAILFLLCFAPPRDQLQDYVPTEAACWQKLEEAERHCKLVKSRLDTLSLPGWGWHNYQRVDALIAELGEAERFKAVWKWLWMIADKEADVDNRRDYAQHLIRLIGVRAWLLRDWPLAVPWWRLPRAD